AVPGGAGRCSTSGEVGSGDGRGGGVSSAGGFERSWASGPADGRAGGRRSRRRGPRRENSGLPLQAQETVQEAARASAGVHRGAHHGDCGWRADLQGSGTAEEGSQAEEGEGG